MLPGSWLIDSRHLVSIRGASGAYPFITGSGKFIPVMLHLVRRTILRFLAVSLTLLPFASLQAAPGIETTAGNAILLEAETDTVLFAKKPDEAFPPASMAKMMTVYIAFEQIANGALSLDSTTRVSAETWRRWAGSEASLMFLSAGEEITVHDLIMGVVVPSGNDASTVLAEMLAGTEESFTDWMNAKAEELGMVNTRFANPSGWPAPDQYTTTRDMAILAERTMKDFPDLYKQFYPVRSFTHGVSPGGKPITQSNRNPLLFTMEGADGLKTGHTEASGYALTASAERDGRRLILVISGTDSSRARARESERLMSYGFRNFKTYQLFKASDTIEDAVVWLGDQETVPLVVEEDVSLTLARGDRRNMTVKLVYDAPLAAPIEKGQPVAVIEVSAPDMETRRVPVVAGQSVGKLTGFDRVLAAFNFLLWGASGLN
jgi:D-alanyl-D-alanine carboxypeptidase (penicillin-binding protein 5/6)